uniref:Lectin, Seed lectin-trefoil, Lectin, PLANT PROTEIN n=1 Tax=Ackermannviridae sp. ctaCq7 TaxID=2827294 RepID=A0A8S5R5A6_9CAUD|nr:MAG TPA: Lectin, Seed lectin-trefoil, Lectin, PLANT PROTEIN [Ackermannviridae sp. ctaCq7]
MFKELNIVLILLLVVLGVLVLDSIRLRIQSYRLNKKLQELSGESYKEFIKRVKETLEKEL